MGREEEMGILIEPVSVRAGANSKGWRTTESWCRQAGSPQGPGSISLDPCLSTLCKTSVCIPGAHQVSPPDPHLMVFYPHFTPSSHPYLPLTTTPRTL